MERFKEIRELGRGGFGKTLLVEDLAENNNRVVIKVPLSEEAEAALLDDVIHLAHLQASVDKTEQTLWKKRALNLINYSQYALNEFGSVIDAQQTARVRRYVDELQIEIDNGDEAAAAEKYIQLDKETDAFPAAVVTMLRINSAVFLAQQAGNLGAADRIRAGYNEIVGAFKRQDYTAVNVKIQEIVPLVNQFANVPVPDPISIDVVPIK